MTTITLLTNATLAYSSPYSATSHYLQSLYASNSVYLEIDDNTNFTLLMMSPYKSNASVVTALSMGQNSVWNIGSGVCTSSLHFVSSNYSP